MSTVFVDMRNNANSDTRREDEEEEEEDPMWVEAQEVSSDEGESEDSDEGEVRSAAVALTTAAPAEAALTAMASGDNANKKKKKKKKKKRVNHRWNPYSRPKPSHAAAAAVAVPPTVVHGTEVRQLSARDVAAANAVLARLARVADTSLSWTKAPQTQEAAAKSVATWTSWVLDDVQRDDASLRAREFLDDGAAHNLSTVENWVKYHAGKWRRNPRSIQAAMVFALDTNVAVKTVCERVDPAWGPSLAMREIVRAMGFHLRCLPFTRDAIREACGAAADSPSPQPSPQAPATSPSPRDAPVVLSDALLARAYKSLERELEEARTATKRSEEDVAAKQAALDAANDDAERLGREAVDERSAHARAIAQLEAKATAERAAHTTAVAQLTAANDRARVMALSAQQTELQRTFQEQIRVHSETLTRELGQKHAGTTTALRSQVQDLTTQRDAALRCIGELKAANDKFAERLTALTASMTTFSTAATQAAAQASQFASVHASLVHERPAGAGGSQVSLPSVTRPRDAPPPTAAEALAAGERAVAIANAAQ